MPMECQVATRSGTGLRIGGATGKSPGVNDSPRRHGDSAVSVMEVGQDDAIPVDFSIRTSAMGPF